MRIGFLQFAPILFHEKQNLEKISHLLKNCKADVIVLPELCTSGYAFSSKEKMKPFSSEANGRIPKYFQALASREDVAIIAGFLELGENNRFYNSQIFVDPQDNRAVYRKIHLFSDEKDIFEPGNTGFKVVKYKDVTLGLMICFDWIFPESARTLSVMGADIICHSANLVLPFCQKAMITRSIENRVFTITSNRTGSDNNGSCELSFTGMSQITDPGGNILASATKTDEVLVVIDVDPAIAQNKMITDKNHILKDRRKEFYE